MADDVVIVAGGCTPMAEPVAALGGVSALELGPRWGSPGLSGASSRASCEIASVIRREER